MRDKEDGGGRASERSETLPRDKRGDFFSNKAGSRVCLAHIDTRNGEDSSSNESVEGKGNKNRLQRKRERERENEIKSHRNVKVGNSRCLFVKIGSIVRALGRSAAASRGYTYPAKNDCDC